MGAGEEMTYAKAGVDIDKESLAVRKIVSVLEGFKRKGFGEPLYGFGHFSGLIDLGSFALALTCDGVGSKILVAKIANKFDTIGIDLVAMNVNDLIAIGAEPLAMLDYISFEKVDEKVAEEIAKGLVEGAKKANISFVGGEIATLPEITRDIDLVGFAVGYVEKDKIVSGKNIEKGDVVVGLESSGLHSNGYTLARKVLLENLPKEYKIGEKTLIEELLTPTKIYVKEVLEVLNSIEVKGLAHITGGGLSNLARLSKKYGFLIENMPEPKEIFKLIQKLGNVSEKEMYRTFNMGIGFCIVVEKKFADDVISICERHGTRAMVIGRVVEGRGVRLKDYIFTY